MTNNAAFPSPVDTSDLRTGPDLHPALLRFLPLIGIWRGIGKGGYPTIDDFDYAHQVEFSHDGRAFLRYESWSWVLNQSSGEATPAAREIGFWRPGTGDDFEVLLTHSTGVNEIYVGRANSATQWELSTDVVARTATAKDVKANHRLYGIVDGALLYAVDMAAMGHELQPHLSARLERIPHTPQ